MLTWNPVGVMGLVAGFVGVSLAWLVFRADPRRPLNVTLAALLFVEGAVQSVCAGGFGNFVTDPRLARGIGGLDQVLYMVTPFLYLLFLGVALDSPLTRPLRTRAARAALLAGLAAVLGYRLAFPEAWVTGLERPWYATWVLGQTDLAILYVQGYTGVLVFALVAAVDSYRRAATPAARSQAKFFALAFGARDAFWIVVNIAILPGFVNPYRDVFWGIFWTQGMPLFMMMFVGALAYGILRNRVFDIDLKVKVAVQKSTVVAAFAVAFLVVSELVERALLVEGTGFGLAAAVGVGLVFRRVERASGLVADRLLPRARDTEEYRVVRKREVYQAAVERGMADDVVTGRERGVLEALREQLGIRAEDGAALEAEVRQALRGVAAPESAPPDARAGG